jgi:hypothetical protein
VQVIKRNTGDNVTKYRFINIFIFTCRVIRLKNGLTACLVSDTSPLSDTSDDENEDDDESDDGGASEEETEDENEGSRGDTEDDDDEDEDSYSTEQKMVEKWGCCFSILTQKVLGRCRIMYRCGELQ